MTWMPVRFDIWCLFKVQSWMDYCGKRFGLTKRFAVVNLLNLCVALYLVSGFLEFLHLGFSLFSIIFQTFNVVIILYAGPKINQRVLTNEGESFFWFINMDFFRWITWFVFGGNRIGFTLAFITGLLTHHPSKGTDFGTEITLWAYWAMSLLWAYAVCCKEPPPKEEKQTFTKLAYQGR